MIIGETKKPIDGDGTQSGTQVEREFETGKEHATESLIRTEMTTETEMEAEIESTEQDVYYDIYHVGGMYLKINDVNAYAIYNGIRYNEKMVFYLLKLEIHWQVGGSF